PLQDLGKAQQPDPSVYSAGTLSWIFGSVPSRAAIKIRFIIIIIFTLVIFWRFSPSSGVHHGFEWEDGRVVFRDASAALWMICVITWVASSRSASDGLEGSMCCQNWSHSSVLMDFVYLSQSTLYILYRPSIPCTLREQFHENSIHRAE